MPTYGYECATCNVQFEVFQKMSDEKLTIHDGCGGDLRKLVYPVGITFKGSGFYVNDYAKGGPKDKTVLPDPASKADAPATSEGSGEAKSESPSEAKSEVNAESKSEAKTETKSESKTETKAETKSESKPSTASAAPLK